MADDDKEQQLREEIASQKAAISIATLPSLSFLIHATGLASPETKARAQFIKELADNEERLELLMESKRVAAVVRIQDELHPPEDSEDCPICLETIKHVTSKTITRFYCCGGFTCNKCHEEREANCEKEGFDMMYRDKCPLCREEFPDDCNEFGTMVLEHANRGRAWAQMQIGKCYWTKAGAQYGFPLDKGKGMKFIKHAADQRYSEALYWMAATETNDSDKKMKLMKEAADLGQPNAQQHLAENCYFRNGDYKKALHYFTLAASQGFIEAYHSLGHCFYGAEYGLTESLILAKHYSEKYIESAKGSINPVLTNLLSSTLYELGWKRYEGELEIPGHSPIPKSVFWARKALNGKSSPV